MAARALQQKWPPVLRRTSALVCCLAPTLLGGTASLAKTIAIITSMSSMCSHEAVKDILNEANIEIRDINRTLNTSDQITDIIFGDAACDPKQAISAANKATQDGAKFIFVWSETGIEARFISHFEDELKVPIVAVFISKNIPRSKIAIRKAIRAWVSVDRDRRATSFESKKSMFEDNFFQLMNSQ